MHSTYTLQAIIPYLEDYYELTYIVVSLVFLSPLGGYVGAALLNNWLHVHFGQRGIALIGPTCHIIAYTGIAAHPPYPALVVLFIAAGFGNGVVDAGWNVWAGNMANSNELLGFLHGFFGLGAVLSPLAATSLITKKGWHWHQFYYIMASCINPFHGSLLIYSAWRRSHQDLSTTLPRRHSLPPPT